MLKVLTIAGLILFAAVAPASEAGAFGIVAGDDEVELFEPEAAGPMKESMETMKKA